MAERTSSQFRRRDIVFTLTTGGTLLVCLSFVGEVTLHVLSHFSNSFRSSRFRQYDSCLGVSLIPNSYTSHNRGCFKGEVYVNQWGMRDRIRSLEKRPDSFRIALLGDSIAEGVHVKPEEVMNIRMEKLLDGEGYKNVEVLNFGVAGYGTTQELLMYETRVRKFHPDLVVLLFFTGNDIMNNSSTLQPKAYGIHTWYAPYYDLSPGGELVFRPVEARRFHSIRSFIEKYSLLGFYLERIWFRFNLNPYRWEGIPIYWGVYSEPLDSEWEQGWLVTEKVLGLFEETVSKDGAELCILVAPDFYDIDPGWQSRMIKEVGKIPAQFKPARSKDRLRKIAERQHLRLDFLAPYLQSYRDRAHLTWPYFSFTCDPHYSSLGHEVVAEAIIAKLRENGFLGDLSQKVR